MIPSIGSSTIPRISAPPQWYTFSSTLPVRQGIRVISLFPFPKANAFLFKNEQRKEERKAYALSVNPPTLWAYHTEELPTSVLENDLPLPPPTSECPLFKMSAHIAFNLLFLHSLDKQLSQVLQMPSCHQNQTHSLMLQIRCLIQCPS